jgi:replicative DNA helicase
MPSTAIAVAEEEDATAPHYDFDADFQAKIAAMTLRDTQFAQLTDGLIRPEFFESSPHAALVKMATDYFAKYKKAPGDKTVLAALLKDSIRSKKLPPEMAKMAIGLIPSVFETDISDRDYVAEQVATFARHQAVTLAIMSSVDLVEKRDFDQIGMLVRKAIDTGVNVNSSAYNYADMISVRSQERKDRAAGLRPPTGITTGFPVIDGYLYHRGWGRRELSVLMGAAKAGKSMALLSSSLHACAAGYRTLYVTLEVAASICANRIDSHISDIVMSELELHPDDVEGKVIEFMSKAAPLVIHEFPTGSMRVSDLRRLIEHYKAQGVTFDMVVIDYADLMAPERMTDNVQENSKSIYVNLRGLAMLEGFALLTATQTNRTGATKAVAGMTDVADDFNKIRIADVVISINKTEEEARLGQARLFFAACRNQKSGFSIRIQQDIDRAKFVTAVLGEE